MWACPVPIAHGVGAVEFAVVWVLVAAFHVVVEFGSRE
jgi:hypothetical protein